MDGAMYTFKLKAEQKHRQVHKRPIFKQASRAEGRIEDTTKLAAKSPDCIYEEVLFEHSDVVSRVARNPWIGTRFCSTSWDSEIQCWEFRETGVIYLATIKGSHVGQIHDAIWTDEHTIVSCGHDYVLTANDVRGNASPSATKLLEGQSAARSLCKVGDAASSTIAAAWDTGLVTLVDLRVPLKPLYALVKDIHKGT